MHPINPSLLVRSGVEMLFTVDGLKSKGLFHLIGPFHDYIFENQTIDMLHQQFGVLQVLGIRSWPVIHPSIWIFCPSLVR